MGITGDFPGVALGWGWSWGQGHSQVAVVQEQQGLWEEGNHPVLESNYAQIN